MMVFIEKIFQRPRTMRRPPTTIFAKYYNPKTKRTTVCATIRLVPSPPTRFAGDFLHHLCGGEPAHAEARKPPPPNQGPCLWRNSFVSRPKSQPGAGHAMNRGNCRVVFEAPFLKMKEVSLDPDFNNRRQVWIDDDDVDTSARHAPKCGFGRLAEEKKEQGNNLYKQKKYSEALALYTSAIELCPTSASYYGNRAACYMMLGKYRQALEDSQQAVRLDSSFVKGHLREAKCHLALGDTNAASRSLDKVRQLEPANATLKMELETLRLVERYLRDGDNAYKKGDYRTVVFCLDQVLRHAVACTRAKVLKAECLSLLGRHQEAQDIASDIIQFDSMNADALYVRGRCLYYQDNVERAMTHFQQVLRLAPDHTKAKDIYRKAKLLKAKKEEGNAAFKEGRLADAYELYSNALEIDPQNVFTNAKLYFNRAIVCSKTNRLNQAVEDCTNAIKLDETYMKAYLKRAQCYMELEMYEEAVREYEKIYRKERTREHKKLLDNAKLELKKSKRKDYYKILGVSKAATDDEIKKAYRKRALIHHPDRHSSASEEIKREQEKKFKELSEAYNILSDPKKRSRYDNGYDLDDADGFADVDPHNIFQTFFGGSAFPGHNADAFGQGFQFPNGFTFQFG